METVSNAVTGINRDLIESGKLADMETLAIRQNVQKCIQRAITSIRKDVEEIVSDSKICVAQSLK